MHKKLRSQQGPLQASIDERSEELAELVGMLARAAFYEKWIILNLWLMLGCWRKHCATYCAHYIFCS